MHRRLVCCVLVGILLTAIGKPKHEVSPSVHAFFYIWYGTPEFDGSYKHWDHEVLGHWDEGVSRMHSKTIGKKHSPPENLHSAFYPLQNAYSSKDPDNLDSQFATMHDAGIDVAVVSWWGQPNAKDYKASDTQGVVTDLAMHHVFQAAERNQKVKVMLHLEPYPGRTEVTFRDDLQYIMKEYGQYNSLYRTSAGLPMYYVYDSYHIDVQKWQRVLTPTGTMTVRGTPLDGVFIGLWLEGSHGKDLKDAGFDGAYSYFASEGFSYGSSVQHWKSMVFFCNAFGLLSSLSVGPGYDDGAIRPWNLHNTKSRHDGEYYSQMWEEAINVSPSFVSITSYNEWGEGTQIEPAREVLQSEKYSKNYQHYNEDPHQYIKLTTKYSTKFRQRKPLKEKKEQLESTEKEL